MVRVELQGITPINNHLAEVERGVGVGNYIVRVLDIPMRQLMGGTRPNIERPEVQRFTGKIPLIHKSYINTLKELLEERGYYGAIHAQLLQCIEVFCSENQVLILNQAVDSFIKQVMDASVVSSLF